MPSFRHPELLLLAAILPALTEWWLTRRRGALRHPVVSALGELPSGRGRIAFWGGLGLRLTALLCFILAAAGLRWPDLKTRLQTDGIAIMMVSDVSSSMETNKDFEWEGVSVTRLQALKNVFSLFVIGGKSPSGEKLEGRPTDQIGLVVFAALPETVCPLTLSHSALVRALKEQKAKRIPGESQTNIVDAMVWGLHALKPAGSQRKVMILLTDGEITEPNPASEWKLSKAIRAAQAQNVPVYTIDASGQAAATAENRPAATLTLQTIAESTGGQHFRAENTESLLNVYQAIDRKERESIESFQYRRWHEAYPWLSLAGFGIFVLVLGLEMTLWRRVP